MSFPQPSSSAYVKGGFSFFRLSTDLTSPGDIYESLVSSAALVIGPDSDISRVNVAYFDPNSPQNMGTVTISPQRAMVGTIFASDSVDTYSPAGRPAKILLWSDDLYDPNYFPAGTNPNLDILTIVPPLLDVIEYFTQPPSLTPGRSDKKFYFQELPANDSSIVLVPYYGRKSAMIEINNLTGADVTMNITGVKFFINDNGQAQETPLFTGTTVANAAVGNFIVTAGEHGVFDYLQIQTVVGAVGIYPITVNVSDQSESACCPDGGGGA